MQKVSAACFRDCTLQHILNRLGFCKRASSAESCCICGLINFLLDIFSYNKSFLFVLFCLRIKAGFTCLKDIPFFSLFFFFFKIYPIFSWCFLCRREAIFLSSLQQGFCRQIQSEGSSADPLRCEEIPVQKLLQNFLQNVSSAQTWGIWLLCSTLSHAVNVYLDLMHFSTSVPNDKWKSKGVFQPKKNQTKNTKKPNQQNTTKQANK